MTRTMSEETKAHLREIRAGRRARAAADRRHQDAQRDVDAWNAAHPIGTPVIRTDDFGAEHHHVTRSIAWVVCDHGSVMVDGISGGYLLSRIRAR